MITQTLNAAFESFQIKLQHCLFSRSEQQAFLEDLRSLIEDGVPVNQAVETIYQISKGPQKQVAKGILDQLSHGQPFAEGLTKWFPQAIVEIIRAGEESGTLAENMNAASRALQQQSKVGTAFLSSLTYPVIVIIIGFLVAIYIRHSVFTNFEAIKPISQWPQNGKLLIVIADFVQHGWWALLLLIGMIIIGICYSLTHLTGTLRHTLDTLPLFSLYRNIIAARLMETLGLLLSNSIILKNALTILQHNATPYLAWHLLLIEFRLSGGRENIAEVLDTGLVSKEDILRLKVIAKGKGFEHALIRLGIFASERNTKYLHLTAKITGGILLAIGAGFAAFMIFAVYGVGSFVGT